MSAHIAETVLALAAAFIGQGAGWLLSHRKQDRQIQILERIAERLPENHRG